MSHTILLVDDEVNLTSALKRALYKEKYDILIANSANDALSVLQQKPVDVIVSDERMPGMSGSGLLTVIRRKYPQVIRIMLTGQINSESAYRAINEGDVYRFLVKPCNVLDLAITIRRALQYKTLLIKLHELLAQCESQLSLLYLLENKQPGIISTQSVKRISFDSDELDFEKVIQRIEMELDKSQKLLSGTLSQGGTQAIQEQPSAVAKEQLHENPSVISSSSNSTISSPQGIKSPQREESFSDPNIPEAEAESVHELSDVKPIMTRTEIKNILDGCGELKGMSPTVAQVLKLTRQSSCSIDQIAKVIKQDHAISLKILKLANSSAYTRGEPVNSVHKAVLRIGMSQIQQAVMNIGIIDKMGGELTTDHIVLPQFWEHSISTGLIAAELAASLENKTLTSDVAFTMGLLHDIGKLIYLEILGDSYRKTIEIAHRLQLPLEQVESRMLLINHADAMDRILHSWKFPAELINPVALHSLSLGNIRRIAPRMLTEVAVLSLANRLSHALLLGTSGNPVLYPTEEYIPALNLKSEIIQTIEDKIPNQTDDVKFALLSNSSVQNWPQYRTEMQDKLKAPFQPLYVSASPQTDSLRIFCDRLRNPQEIEKPNLGMVYLKSVNERVMLTTRYKEAEQNAQVQNLPLILFSPQGNIALENNFMANRRFEMLPFPTFIPRILTTINSILSSREL